MITITITALLWVIAALIAFGFFSILWSKPMGLFIIMVGTIIFMIFVPHIAKSDAVLPLAFITAFLAGVTLIEWLKAVGATYEKPDKKPPTVGPTGPAGDSGAREPRYGERK